MPRRKKQEDDRTTFERQRDFLIAYGDTFNVERAATLADIDTTTHHRWVRRDEKYRAAFAKRKELAGQYLESIAIQRAGEGWDEPVWYQGEQCGTVRRFDSGLMQFLLRGMLPEKYAAKTEISGPAGAPIQAKIEVVFVKPAQEF